MFENMGLAVLGCTFVLGGLVIYHRRKAERINEKRINAYWAREDHSNTVRRKDITFLPYLNIPLDRLPMDPSEDEEVASYQDTVKILSGKRVINLSDMSNTDLKETYGVANLSVLSEYDENYTTLVNTLTRWGSRLIDLEQYEDAVTVLEYGISIDSDVTRNFLLLASEYRRRGEVEKIDALIEKAENLSTVLKDSLVTKLKALRDND